MKRVIVNSSSRGQGSPKDPSKQELRQIVNAVYDEVINRGIIDYDLGGNIISAGKGYYIDWYRNESGWFIKNEADKIANDIQKVIEDLGYIDQVMIKLVKAPDFLVEMYGEHCFVVRCVFKSLVESTPYSRTADQENLRDIVYAIRDDATDVFGIKGKISGSKSKYNITWDRTSDGPIHEQDVNELKSQLAIIFNELNVNDRVKVRTRYNWKETKTYFDENAMYQIVVEVV